MSGELWGFVIGLRTEIELSEHIEVQSIPHSEHTPSGL